MISAIATWAFYIGFALWVFFHYQIALFIAGIAAAILGVFALVGFLKSI